VNQISAIAANDDVATTAPAVIEPSSIMTKVIELASIPGTNADMVDRLIAWHEREQVRQISENQRVRYIRALAAAQAEIQPIARDAWNDQTKSKYAKLEKIDIAIRPILTRHGFTCEFDSEDIEGGEERVVLFVSHIAGHVKRFHLDAPPDTVGFQGTPNKTPLHGLGSVVSYLRRYLKCMAFDLVTFDDNDGNRAPRNDNTGELIPKASIDLLYKLIAETGTNERKLLIHMGFPDLTTIKDVPAGAFAKFKNALLDKKHRLAQRAANSQTRNGAAA
jgi:hypothetical protein